MTERNTALRKMPQAGEEILAVGGGCPAAAASPRKQARRSGRALLLVLFVRRLSALDVDGAFRHHRRQRTDRSKHRRQHRTLQCDERLLFRKLPVSDPDALVRFGSAGPNQMRTDTLVYGFMAPDARGRRLDPTFSYPLWRVDSR